MRSRNTEPFKKRLAHTRKPQVKLLSCLSNSLNFKAQKGYQRRLDPLPFTRSLVADSHKLCHVLLFAYCCHFSSRILVSPLVWCQTGAKTP